MLTIIEVRIVYKTQQKKEPQLGFSINNQEKEKWKGVMGFLKDEVISRKPTYHIRIYTMVTNVGIYDKYYSIDLKSHLIGVEPQSFLTILPNWNATKYAQSKPP